MVSKWSHTFSLTGTACRTLPPGHDTAGLEPEAYPPFQPCQGAPGSVRCCWSSRLEAPQPQCHLGFGRRPPVRPRLVGPALPPPQ
eukprot:9852339-Heterocapsa_arctica.AAC.1